MLAPYQANPEDWFVLHRCEIAGRKLLAVLPAGALRQRVEDTFRRVMGEAPSAPFPDADDPEDLHTIVAPPLRERAELRALRLYIAAPECRAVIATLPFETPLYRAALEVLVGIQGRIPQGLSPERDPLPAGCTPCAGSWSRISLRCSRISVWLDEKSRGCWDGSRGWS